jgi:hypothetical protein
MKSQISNTHWTKIRQTGRKNIKHPLDEQVETKIRRKSQKKIKNQKEPSLRAKSSEPISQS